MLTEDVVYLAIKKAISDENNAFSTKAKEYHHAQAEAYQKVIEMPDMVLRAMYDQMR